MTPHRFHECLDAIGWSQRALADRLGVHETRTRRWASGRYPIPANVAVWLGTHAQRHEAMRLPAGWEHAASRLREGT
jgi:DNA-binding transcriptional regulator YdaS (Cro superfamily)